MSSDSQRRAVQAAEYQLGRTTQGTMGYRFQLEILQTAKSTLATELFYEGIREKSHMKIKESLTLMSAVINFCYLHFSEDVSYYQNALRVEQVNLAERMAQLRKESWYR